MRAFLFLCIMLWTGLLRADPTPPPAGSQAAQEDSADNLKVLIREDLLAVRRARYALKRARVKLQQEQIRSAEGKLDGAKRQLKRHRVRLREVLGLQVARGGAHRRKKMPPSMDGPQNQSDFRRSTAARETERGGEDAH